jgi:mannose-6-phosphate isomerase-like protein (cupin superfamily)
MRLEGKQEKGWGHEDIWVTTDKYCGKMMHFKNGKKFSMHFHRDKEETWFVISGKFLVRYITTQDAKIYEKVLEPGDVWHNPPLLPHQLFCMEEGVICEVSTPDSVEDNYRVMPGDSQNESTDNGL